VRALIVALVIIVALAIAAVSSAKTVLKGTVGPDFTIKLTNATGKRVKTLKAGTYALRVADKSASHNFHLTGPGVNKAITSIGFRGTKTVSVTLKPGRYIYLCDAHPADMKASFKVTR
jgi:plastocyanin